MRKGASHLIGFWIFFSLLLPNLAGHLSARTKYVASVNGKKLTEKALIAEMNRILPMTAYHPAISKQKMAQIRKQALDKLIDEELLYQEATRRHIQADPDSVRYIVDMMKKSYPSEKVFNQYLKRAGLSHRDWVQQIKRRLIIRKFIRQEIIEKTHVTDKDLREYYRKNKRKFVLPEQWELRHILISVDPGAGGEGWKKGQEKANRIYKRLLNGKDFAKIAREVSDDTTSRSQGGYIGWIHAGQLINPLNESVKKLKIGEITKPLRSIYGFHIFRLENRKASRQLSYKEIDKNYLRKELRNKWIREKKQELIQRLRSRARIKIFN